MKCIVNNIGQIIFFILTMYVQDAVVRARCTVFLIVQIALPTASTFLPEISLRCNAACVIFKCR